VGSGRKSEGGELDTYLMEKRYVRKEGTIVWVHLTVSAVSKCKRQDEAFLSRL